MKSVLIFAMILLSVQACEENSQKKDTDQKEGPKLGEVFNLSYNQPVQMADAPIKLTFSDLKDSRCPKNVNCIQAGEARATIIIEQEGKNTETVEMTAKGNCYNDEDGCGSIKRILGYKLLLSNVYPYPEGGVQGDRSKSYLHVLIRE